MIFRVVLPYVLFAGLWIILSDRFLAVLFTDPIAIMHWSIYKGLAFVVVTALLLTALLRIEVWARERGEAAMKAAEQRLVDVIEFLPDATFVIDQNKRVIAWNHACEVMTAVKKEAMLGQGDFAYAEPFHGERRATLIDLLDTPSTVVEATFSYVQRKGETVIAESFVPFLNGGKGAYLWGVASPLFNRDGQRCGAIEVIRDITEHKRAEESRDLLQAQLIQSQKLEAIGTIASGVAHEINNPIMGIMGYAQMISESVGPETPIAEFATGIGKASQRIATIVKNLLSFARVEKQKYEPARLCEIVEGTLSLVRTVLRHDQIILEVEVPEDLPVIKCRIQQIQQVIMNLLTNARDALNEKYAGYDADKKIIIVAKTTGSDAARIPMIEGEAPHSWLRLTVEDHGAGIPVALRERIIDPFFTTKSRDKGTGLGLSISHGIIKDHGGALWFQSEVGQGTKFHVELPVIDHG